MTSSTTKTAERYPARSTYPKAATCACAATLALLGLVPGGCERRAEGTSQPAPRAPLSPPSSTLRYLVAGPFAVPDAKERLVAAPLGVEGALAPKAGDPFGGTGETWTALEPDAEGVAPIEPAAPDSKAVHYFVTYLEQQEEREVVLVLDAGAGVRAWLNGQTVLLQEIAPDAETVHVEAPFTLPAGQSALVVAVGSNGETLRTRFVDPQGKPAAGMGFRLATTDALAPRTEEDPARGRRWLAEGHPSKWRDPILSVVGEVVQISKPVAIEQLWPYTEAHMTVKYRVLKTTLGEYDREHLVVAHWCVIDSKYTPETKLRVGDHNVLNLDLYKDHKEFEFVTLSDDLGFDEHLVLYMVLSWDKAE